MRSSLLASLVVDEHELLLQAEKIVRFRAFREMPPCSHVHTNIKEGPSLLVGLKRQEAIDDIFA